MQGRPSDEWCVVAKVVAQLSPNGWRNNPLAKWYEEMDPEGQTQQLQQVYQQITAELQNASKRRVQCEDDLRTLRTELAQFS